MWWVLLLSVREFGKTAMVSNVANGLMQQQGGQPIMSQAMKNIKLLDYAIENGFIYDKHAIQRGPLKCENGYTAEVPKDWLLTF